MQFNVRLNSKVVVYPLDNHVILPTCQGKKEEILILGHGDFLALVLKTTATTAMMATNATGMT